ncbi:MAG TPA: VOC family protein [Aeromicrobium sp.]|nr:VOC family protein [Aeromicrobium sp.]
MTISLTACHITVTDADLALAFYRDALGLDVVADVANPAGRWITVASPDQPGVSIVLSDAHAGRSEEDGDALAKLVTKGAFQAAIFSVPNLDETFEKVRASGAEVMQEPMDQPWGVRDCAFRDPSGNMVRINQG